LSAIFVILTRLYCCGLMVVNEFAVIVAQCDHESCIMSSAYDIILSALYICSPCGLQELYYDLLTGSMA